MKRRYIIIIGMLTVLVAILASCSDATPTTTTTPETISSEAITPSEAMYIMAYQDVIILDVRTLEEFNTGYIPNAVSLPIDELADAVTIMIPNKEQIILIYCRSGNRSADAADILVALGYINVYDFGGILDWTGEIHFPSH